MSYGGFIFFMVYWMINVMNKIKVDFYFWGGDFGSRVYI